VKNVAHRVDRSTIARILKAAGVPPIPERPTWWQTFLRAHWGAIAGADFFTTEVWTWRGLVTFYAVFVIDFASRRVQIVGSTPYPDEQFMQQVVGALRSASLVPVGGKEYCQCLPFPETATTSLGVLQSWPLLSSRLVSQGRRHGFVPLFRSTRHTPRTSPGTLPGRAGAHLDQA
jgi:hypothetical protein